jgi:hypothetical protein
MLVLAVTVSVLALVGCKEASWQISDAALGSVAADVAAHAQSNDVTYFTGMTADRQAIPRIIEQINRSGLATNYSDHLIVESADSARLVYGAVGDDTAGGGFAIDLSLVDGKPRVDQVTTTANVDVTAAPVTSSEPTVGVEPAHDAPGDIIVGVSLPAARIRGYGLQSALVQFTNASDVATTVPVPLSVQVRIVDEENRVVSEGFEPSDEPQARGEVFLPPGATVHETVRFIAPSPGRYVLNAEANGIWSLPSELETTY